MIESNGLDIQTILLEEYDKNTTDKILEIQDTLNDMLLGDHIRVILKNKSTSLQIEPKSNKSEPVIEEVKAVDKKPEPIVEEVKVVDKKPETIVEEVKVEPTKQDIKDVDNSDESLVNWLRLVIYMLGSILVIVTGKYLYNRIKNKLPVTSKSSFTRTEFKTEVQPETTEQEPNQEEIQQEAQPETTEQEPNPEEDENNKK